jgi:dTDP-4-dehydrorhamnose reductase
VEAILQKARAGAPNRVVGDQVCTPTSVAALARAVAHLLDSHAFGLYHVTSGGACSWHEFAAAILEMSGQQARAEPIRSDEWKTPARRPRYSVLSDRRWQEAGFAPLPHWRDALAEYLASRQ